MWRRRRYDVIDVGTIDQGGESITSKVHGPGGGISAEYGFQKVIDTAPTQKGSAREG
jgi:hypothetical protein